MTAVSTFTLNATLSSREIAQLTGKRHSDVLESIRKMEDAWFKVNGRKFPLVEYRDSKGEFRPEYQLSKIECLYIATKFNDESRARLILRWEELENAKPQSLDFNNPETVLQLAQNWADERKKREEVEQKLKIAAPKALFADAVSQSQDTILVRELAKMISQNGIEMGQDRLFTWLKANGYLIRGFGSDYNLPTQKSMNLGLFEIKETAVTHSSGVVKINKTPKVTGKGQVYFINKFLTSK